MDLFGLFPPPRPLQRAFESDPEAPIAIRSAVRCASGGIAAAKAEATQGRAGSYKKTQSHVEHSSEAARKKKEEATEAGRAQKENMVAWARSLSHD